MSSYSKLDKHLAKCSHCYLSIRLKCPVCGLNKIPRHCKIYKSPSSLWWHIQQEHGDFNNRKFSKPQVLEVLNKIVVALEWGMIPN